MTRRSRRSDHRILGPPALDRGDRIEVAPDALSDTGEAMAEHEGLPVHVAGGIPGEHLVVEITRRYREYAAASVVAVKSADPARVPPPCPYYLACSGCQWQHVSYARQLEYKRRRVEIALAAHPATAHAAVRPTVPSPAPLGYRNHARFTISKAGEVGFVNRHTRRFLRVDECMLMAPPVNHALRQMQGKLQGMTQTSVRVGVNTGDRLIQPKLPDPEIPLDSGQSHYVEEMCGRTFRIAGSSFFQVNLAQAERIVRELTDRLGLTGRETVVDAYAGVGTYATLLAPLAGRVVAIEDSPSAVEDARANAAGLHNVEFVLGRTEKALGEFDGPVDAIILDPPRVGCHPEALAAVAALRPRRVAMVSCDPPSMARDLASLSEAGAFILEDVQPLDMFPQTYHIECIAILRRAP